MSKSRLWLVSQSWDMEDRLGTRPPNGWHRPVITVEPGDHEPSVLATSWLRIRSISPKAAARRFIRNNLTVSIYCQDDGYNAPSDLVSASSHNRGKPRQEMKYAKRHAAGFGAPVVVIKK